MKRILLTLLIAAIIPKAQANEAAELTPTAYDAGGIIGGIGGAVGGALGCYALGGRGGLGLRQGPRDLIAVACGVGGAFLGSYIGKEVQKSMSDSDYRAFKRAERQALMNDDYRPVEYRGEDRFDTRCTPYRSTHVRTRQECRVISYEVFDRSYYGDGSSRTRVKTSTSAFVRNMDGGWDQADPRDCAATEAQGRPRSRYVSNTYLEDRYPRLFNRGFFDWSHDVPKERRAISALFRDLSASGLNLTESQYKTIRSNVDEDLRPQVSRQLWPYVL